MELTSFKKLELNIKTGWKPQLIRIGLFVPSKFGSSLLANLLILAGASGLKTLTISNSLKLHVKKSKQILLNYTRIWLMKVKSSGWKTRSSCLNLSVWSNTWVVPKRLTQVQKNVTHPLELSSCLWLEMLWSTQDYSLTRSAIPIKLSSLLSTRENAIRPCLINWPEWFDSCKEN